MPRYLLATVLALFISLNAAAQEEQAPAAGKPATETDLEADAEDADEDAEDADLDQQTYEENEDDFVPTQEIPADEPIPFPTNI